MQSHDDREAKSRRNGSGSSPSKDELMQNTETRLLLGFFQQAFQAGQVEPDPAKYLEKFRSGIKTAGRFFAYLGLAKADKRSPLGWKATAPLLDLIANSKARRPKPSRKSASLVDTLILDLMLETVLGSTQLVFAVMRSSSSVWYSRMSMAIGFRPLVWLNSFATPIISAN